MILTNRTIQPIRCPDHAWDPDCWALKGEGPAAMDCFTMLMHWRSEAQARAVAERMLERNAAR